MLQLQILTIELSSHLLFSGVTSGAPWCDRGAAIFGFALDAHDFWLGVGESLIHLFYSRNAGCVWSTATTLQGGFSSLTIISKNTFNKLIIFIIKSLKVFTEYTSISIVI